METVAQLLYSACLSSLFGMVALISQTWHNYSRTGPGIPEEVERKFRWHMVYAGLRLALWCYVIFLLTALPGPIFWQSCALLLNIEFKTSTAFFFGLCSSALVIGYFFCYQLLFSPGAIQLSFQYRFSRLYGLHDALTPAILKSIKFAGIFVWVTISGLSLFSAALPETVYIFAINLIYGWLAISIRVKEPAPLESKPKSPSFPNIVMIGADTLRCDRLGAYRYRRNLTPNIDKLCADGVLLGNCITPVARTAPSVASLFSGLWPYQHGIRDNYPSAEECRLPHPSLVQCLKAQGYSTLAVSDWAGADFGKIDFGFETVSLPEDQWNLKLLFRQGPSVIRGFLSLFTNNSLGKKYLPELYFLAGMPLTGKLGRECRQFIASAAREERPFFLNLFTSTTHVPFTCDYPYYKLFTPENYRGESKFIMTKLATPCEIVDKQQRGSDYFDVPQIINLYDSCVRQFDDEVGKIVDFIEQSGLSENTLIVIYSDHGADFFETGCWGQGNTLLGKDPSGRIPLVMKGPGMPKGVKFEPVCRAVDVMPTLLGWLKLDVPEHLPGTNLMPYILENRSPNLYAYQETGIWLGKVPGLHPEQILYPNIVELLDIPDQQAGTLVINAKYYPTVIQAKSRSIQDERWKLICIATHRGPVYQLYDLETDAYRDVASEFPEIYARLQAQLAIHLKADPYWNPAPATPSAA